MARRGGAPRPDLAAGPRKPFADDHALAVLAKTVLEEAPRLRELRGDVNRALDELVARMLQIDRENHPQDAAAVLAALEQSVERERAGDHGSASVTRVNIGFTLSEVGAYEEARDVLEAVLEVADRMELGSIGALARSNLGRVLGLLGELDRAWDLELEAIEAFAIQGDERLQNGSRIYLAWIRELTGDLDAAERYAREAVERTGATPTMRAQALGRLAAVLLARSAPREALSAAREAFEVHQSLGQIEEGEAKIRLARARALYESGHIPDARAAAEALRRLEERAAKIADDAWRESFLGRVPANRETRELARVLGVG